VSFSRYPSYKDSGVEWLGQVPEHWEIEPLKYNSYVKGRIGWQNLRSDEFTEEGPYLITGMHFKDGSVDWGSCFHITKDRYAIAPEIQVRIDDVLITKDGSIGKLAHIRELPDKASLNSHLLVVRPLDGRYNSRFLYLLLSSSAFRTHIELNQSGVTFQGITQEAVVRFPLVLPSIAEQTAIAEFLDRETGKIDELVAEQRRLMELLKEKRQAVISHAVTRGLNPAAPLKPSGIEWLGDVPAHWQVVALKHLVSRPIIDGPHETPIKRDEGTPFVSAEAVSQGAINFDKIWGYISPEDHAEYSKRYKPRRGDILLVKLGATTGTPAIVEIDDDFNIWVPLAAIRPKAEIEPRFILHVLRSDNLKIAYELNWTYGTQQTLGLRTISNLLIPMPPKDEREAIVKHLDSILPSFELLTAEAQRAIDLLQERRTALISAAVTGQIDVRGGV
jgi:type I restriction enzyme S subunit